MAEPSLQLGNGNWAGKSDNLLAYHKANNNFYADELTFARASTGTIVNADGLIEEVPYNLLQQSNSFDTTWVSSGTTETSGQSGYDGTNDAWLLQRSDGAARFVYQTVSIIKTSTFSVYAKAGNVDWMYFNNGAGASVYFDLENGAVGDITGGNTASIESVGNGWYRCSVVLTNGSDNRIYPAISNGTINGLVGANIYIQDAQLNSGSTAKTYYPTTTRLNIPRVDYLNNANGSLLLESQRTNLITYSEDFSQSVWRERTSDSTQVPIITSGYAISPDGTQNASRVLITKPATDNDYAVVDNYMSVAKSVGDKFTNSIYIKANGISQVGKEVNLYAFDGSMLSLITYALTNSWVRIDAVHTSSTGAGNMETLVIGKARASSGGVSLANMATDFIISFAQLEQGSYATSYIPTSGTTVTKLADACATTGLSDVIGQTEGTMFAEINIPSIGSVGSFSGFRVNDGTSANQISFIMYPNGRIQSTTYVGGTLVVNINDSGYGLTSGIHKIAVAYKLNDYVLYVDGSIVGSDTSANVPLASQFELSYTNGGSHNYNQAQLYKTRLTNAELATLTTL